MTIVVIAIPLLSIGSNEVNGSNYYRNYLNQGHCEPDEDDTLNTSIY